MAEMNLKTLEMEIKTTMSKAIEDGIITAEESKDINTLIDKLEELILEDNVVTPEEMKTAERIYGEAMAILKKAQT